MRVAATLPGLLGLGSFYHTWVGATLIVPLTVLALLCGVWWPGCVLGVYYTYRAVVPRRPWPWLHATLSRLIHSPSGRYFRQQKTVFEAAPGTGETLQPRSKTLLAFHPHGVLCAGWSVNGCMGQELLDSRIHWLGTSALFKLPVISDVLSWYRGQSADGASMKSLMRDNENIALIPGGFEEATLFARDKHRVYLRRRAGFIKYALRHGYTIRPVYTFGEERTYWAFQGCARQRLWLNRFRLPGVVFCGKYGPIMPDDDIDLVTVVGKPLKLPHINDPTQAQVVTWHKRYIEALQSMFDAHKAKYAAQGAEATLEIL